MASDLASRDYLQEMVKTGKAQVTDAFLSGADGTTINYTVAVPIMEEDMLKGGLFAAINGAEIDRMLQDDRAVHVLVGSEQQYMGGVKEEQYELPAAAVRLFYKPGQKSGQRETDQKGGTEHV